MLIFPYSTALTLGRPPYISYAAVMLCLVIFSLQLGSPITHKTWCITPIAGIR